MITQTHQLTVLTLVQPEETRERTQVVQRLDVVTTFAIQ
jgi:hypothetical protein